MGSSPTRTSSTGGTAFCSSAVLATVIGETPVISHWRFLMAYSSPLKLLQTVSVSTMFACVQVLGAEYSCFLSHIGLLRNGNHYNRSARNQRDYGQYVRVVRRAGYCPTYNILNCPLTAHVEISHALSLIGLSGARFHSRTAPSFP